MSRFGMVCAFASLALLPACAPAPVNRSFDLTPDQARDLLEEMRDEPRSLERPVLVLGGWIDPGIATGRLERELVRVSTGDRVAAVSFAFMPSFESCRKRLLDFIDDRFPGDDPDWTEEFDVIAISMGGLVARYAAGPVPDGERRLRIARLFTIATPHQGARMATVPSLDSLVIDMRPGSEFRQELDLAPVDYEIFPYARLGDWIVGADNAAPPGDVAWWVPNLPFQPAHAAAYRDPRILADIFRRLRSEPPLTEVPREPLPSS